MAATLMRTLLRAIPNALSLFRLASSPVILWFAWTGKERHFLTLLSTAMITDLFDGSLARLLDHTTELGAKLDSMADFLIALAIIPCVWWLWPHIIEAEFNYFMLILLGSTLQLSCSLVKFRKAPSYHTWSSKAATFLLSTTLIIMLFTQTTTAPFRFSAILHLTSTVESVLITIVLPRWSYNVTSIWHALSLAKQTPKPNEVDELPPGSCTLPSSEGCDRQAC